MTLVPTLSTDLGLPVTGLGAGTPGRGRIVLVGAGPGARDLLTLRALRHLQEADVIFYDRLVEADVLDLARPGAERVFVGKHVGAHAWPQGQINAIIVAEARKGRRVVRLKSGDPGIFGRAGEELEVARAAGIPVELVPGITAASAAAAALGRSLTERGQSDTLVLTTGTGAADNPLPDCVRHAAPGTTIAFYMAVGQAPRITAGLLARGMPPGLEVQIAVEVEKSSQRLLRCPLGELATVLARNGVKGCALILATWPSQRPATTAGDTIDEERGSAPHLSQDPGQEGAMAQKVVA
ncbi:uroporphyrinogen-III C-methyltransferase [Tritonibacter horizontis]|uniref:uroporphyrinogen-III C-methyltransferase n=1 Tax=Tritonibacter horizontis TaxID=1768241 RepID=A0A132BQA8_9RHOB|nr:uroporphyrinogen-III C-methyltransferase [Tritonibacter horizontis]KUP90595.1 siroheme synthase [Tritonibacter horizontis]